MTVKQLIDHLCTCNPEALVVLSSDSEGNDYRPLNEVSTDEVYITFDFSSSVEVYDREAYEEIDKDNSDDTKPCITLYPID